MNTKIAVVQLNPIVGDISGNVEQIIKQYDTANANGADIVVVGECAVTGYPLEDLVLRKSFMEVVEAETHRLIEYVNNSTGAALVFGTPRRAPNGNLYNVGIFAKASNDINKDYPTKFVVFQKHELPNYGVFDEKRVFNSGQVSSPVWFRGHRIGVMICEDGWFDRVAFELARDRADYIIWINGSPYEQGKRVTRRQIFANRMKATGIPMVYVNLVGGQDELVFDGGSFGFDGVNFFEAPEFETGIFYYETNIVPQNDRDLPWEGVRLVPTEYPLDWSKYPMIDAGDIGHDYRASVLGTRDYFHKQGFKSAVIGYSGGVDSGIVAAIAVDALGVENVTLVSLPSGFSSEHSKSDAREGAKRLGTEFRTIAIEPVVNALRAAYSGTMFNGPNYAPETDLVNLVPQKLTGTADENIQARARGTILMAISNQEGKVVLTTGNKSEVSVGYATLYGDMAGGYNPIKDFYKTRVWSACRWRNALTPEQVTEFGFLGKGNVDVVPEEIIVKPPSAELRPDQKDSDSLPPYEILDAILERMVELEMSVLEIIAEGFAEKDVVRVRRLIDSAEYKRRQAAPGVKITNKLHGRDRRYPIVNRYCK